MKFSLFENNVRFHKMYYNNTIMMEENMKKLLASILIISSVVLYRYQNEAISEDELITLLNLDLFAPFIEEDDITLKIIKHVVWS